MAPKRSSVRSTTERRVSPLVISPGVIRASRPAAAASNPGSERAVRERRAPARANSAAHAAPIPSEAPVIRITLPFSRMRARRARESYTLLLIRRKRHNVSMSSGLIPLFPLSVVVFPRTALPLHIFEERYKEMVGNAIRDNSEFGIVLAQEDGIVNAGCTVIVEKLKQMYPDGRMDILTRGRRRFEIQSLNQEKPYLQAEVNFFDDDDFTETPAELRDRAVSQYQALSQLGVLRDAEEPNLKDPQLSFQLAHAVPDLNFLTVLLRQRSETGRLTELNQFLSQYIPRQQAIERVKTLAPTNGHGGKPVGI